MHVFTRAGGPGARRPARVLRRDAHGGPVPLRFAAAPLRWALAGLLGVACGAAHAGALLDVYRGALDSDPIYLSTLRQGEAAAEFAEQAKALRRPSVSLMAARAHTQNQVIQSPGQSVYAPGMRSYPGGEYALSIVQPLVNPVSDATGVQAVAKSQQIDAELDSNRQELVWRVAERYLAAAAAHESLGAVQAELAALQDHLERVTIRQRAGLARSTDALESRARLGEARARAAEVRLRYVDALEALQEVTGSPPSRLGLLAAGAPDAAVEAVSTAQALAFDPGAHPLVRAKRHAVAVAEAELQRQRGAGSPSVDAMLRIGRARANGSLYGGLSDIETNELRVTLNLPIYAGGMIASREREAAKLLDRAREDLRGVERSLARGVETARARIRSAGLRTEAMLTSVRANEEAFRGKQLAYQSGLATNLSVLDARRELAQAQGEFARAQYDLLLAMLALRRMTGLLDEQDVRFVDDLLARDVDPDAGRN